MKSERIYAAFGAADDELLNRSCEAGKQNRPNHWRRWGTLAACLCLIIIGATIFSNFYHSGQNLPSNGIIFSYDNGNGDSTLGCYPAPENGTWSYTDEVKAAVKKYSSSEYAGQEIVYFLKIDIFSGVGLINGGGTVLTPDSDEMKSELERLTGLGYKVGYAEGWAYEGQGEQINYTYVAGYFTADELENFSASEDYGYFFDFASNGDGSPVDAGQGVITDFYDAESGFYIS